MNTALSTRSALFCDTALAERIERAEAELIALASRASRRRVSTPGFVLPVAGGVASFAEAGSPLNKVAGLGFADDDIWDIAAISAFFGMSNRMANFTALRPNAEFYAMGRG